MMCAREREGGVVGLQAELVASSVAKITANVARATTSELVSAPTPRLSNRMEHSRCNSRSGWGHMTAACSESAIIAGGATHHRGAGSFPSLAGSVSDGQRGVVSGPRSAESAAGQQSRSAFVCFEVLHEDLG